MKYVLTFKKHAISAVLAGLIIAMGSSIAHAESGANTQGDSGEKQAQSGWNKTESGKGGWLSAIFGGSGAASTPEQTGASSGWSSPREGSGSCGHSPDGEEDFVCKLVRIFWGTDRPYGPNRDMDDNIAAGGAGG